MTAVSSILLLVVAASPPNSSFSTLPSRRMAPHPPGPGLPRQAPSVNISTTLSVMDLFVRSLRDRRQRAAPRALLPPRGGDEPHAGDALHRAHHIDAAGDRPPA